MDMPDFDQQVFRLLDLPPELYSQICKLAVTSDEPLLATSMVDVHLTARTMTQPPITRICRVLRKESLQTFYSTTKFQFLDDCDRYSGLEDWVRATMRAGYWRKGWIEEVYLYSDHPNPQESLWFVFLDKNIKLVELERNCEDPVRGAPCCVDLYRLTIAEMPEGDGWKGKDVKALRAEIMDAFDPLSVSG